MVTPAAPTRDCSFVFFGERLYVRRYATVDLDGQARLVTIHRDHHRLPGHTHKGVLVGGAEGNGAHNERLTPWGHLDPSKGLIRVWVFPRPQVVLDGESLERLALTDAGHSERALQAGLEPVVAVGYGQEG